MVKRVLMIAFHYPPISGSSGIQRTLKFSQYLPQLGWQPLVLAPHPRAYAHKRDDQTAEIPAEAIVRRCFALDASRHLAIRGRYPSLLALPDRWAAWVLGAIPTGLRMISAHRPQLIWSTYPIATAHLIGLVLHRLTGLPWIADLRDPMTDTDYPAGGLRRRVFLWIEAQTLMRCSVAVCTTPGAIRTYRARFPQLPRERFALIENGYDEGNFAQATQARAATAAPRRFVLVHSGVIYPSERDPLPLFRALAALLQSGQLAPARFHLILRATAHDAYLQGLIDQHGIGALVSLAPHIAYHEALAEMLSADGLLILQGGNCNHQIPAKLYEYLRARRPILALTDPAGDTAATLRKAGVDSIAPLDSAERIMQALPRFVAQAEAGAAPLASADAVAANSRQARSKQLAELLDRVALSPPPLHRPAQPQSDTSGAP